MSEPLPPPDALRTPIKSTPADAMVSLGILTAACETAEPGKKSRCQELLKPLEENQASAVDTLTNIIVELGDEGLDDALDRFNFIIYQATQKAKEVLIEQGKMDNKGNMIITE